MAVRLRLLPALAALALAGQPRDTCASADVGGCAAFKVGGGGSNCTELGFDTTRLTCGTCDLLEQRIKESGVVVQAIVDECRGCCRPEAPIETFSSALLFADASVQDKDTDVHDFIKRKAPKLANLEVEYREGARPVVELEKEEEPGRMWKADVSGWKSDDLFEFLSVRLRKADGEDTAAVGGAWTAEVQSCSG